MSLTRILKQNPGSKQPKFGGRSQIYTTYFGNPPPIFCLRVFPYPIIELSFACEAAMSAPPSSPRSFSRLGIEVC